MESLPEHTIQFAGLKDGAHAFDFVLDDAFFQATGMEDFAMGGQVKAHVDLNKSEHLLVVNMHVDGHVNTTCDHCNGPMQQPVSDDQRQIFKLTNESGIDDEELVALDVHAHEVNLTHYLFECISLHLPIRHVHTEGQCDPEVDAALQQIKTEHPAGTDPRWDALKALKTRKN
jgi:uncharacterized metal-binding protein YceD (DUF177 family)